MASDIGNLGKPYGNARDYVLVCKVDPATGIRFEEEVHKSEFETSEEYRGLSLDSDNVREAHPPENRPTSDLTKEEARRFGVEREQG